MEDALAKEMGRGTNKGIGKILTLTKGNGGYFRRQKVEEDTRGA